MSVTVSFSQGNARQSGSFRKWMLCTTRRIASLAHSSVCHQLCLLLSASELRMNMGKKTAVVKWGRGGERKKVMWGWSWQVHGQLQPDAGQWGGSPPPKPRAVLHPIACIVSSISASEHPHHRHSFSSLSSLLKTVVRRPCCDTVINTLYFYFPPSFLHRHWSNMIRWHKKNKTASSNCHRLHHAFTFHSPHTTPTYPIWPFFPQALPLQHLLPSITVTTPPTPTRLLPSHQVCTCLRVLLVGYSLSAAACPKWDTAARVCSNSPRSFCFSLALSHTLHPAFAGEHVLPCADQFLLFQRRTHTHCGEQASHERGCIVVIQLSCNNHCNVNATCTLNRYSLW